jgi:hypothetical protein
MEYINSDLFTAKIPINIKNDLNIKPYFFIKWSKNSERYRISTSFKYLNLKFGLHINIIRDLDKIKNKDFINLITNDYIAIDKDLIYYIYTDNDNKTEIFYIIRTWENKTSGTIVFFSEKYWSLNDYLAKD